jgi:hypothetical protein
MTLTVEICRYAVIGDVGYIARAHFSGFSADEKERAPFVKINATL